MTFRASQALTLSLALIAWTEAHGAQLDYTIGVGVEHNDNINLSETAPVGDTILEPTLAFTLGQSGSTVQAAATGLFEYRDFLQGRFGDDFLGQLDARVNWSAIPGWLDFGIEEALGVQPIDNLSPNTPANQQQTNVFAVGPTFNFRLGQTMRGQAELRYTNSYAEETEAFNSDRGSAALRIIKDLSTGSTLAANVVDEHIRFRDSTIDPDYSRYGAFGRYTRKWSKFDLVADFGYSWLDYSGLSTLARDRDDALARATLDWRATERSTLTLDLAHQLSDAASGLLAGTTTATTTGNPLPVQIATGNTTATSAAYLENRIDVGYAYRGARAAFTLSPYYRKLDFGALNDNGASGTAGEAINQSARGATLGASWLLRPLLGVGVAASAENLRYDTLDREDRSRTLQAFLRQQFSRHWVGRIDLTRYERDSNAVGQSADQNIVFVELTYTR